MFYCNHSKVFRQIDLCKHGRPIYLTWFRGAVLSGSTLFAIHMNLLKALPCGRAILFDFLTNFCNFYRVTDEALIAETVVWPIFVLSYECFLCS